MNWLKIFAKESLLFLFIVMGSLLFWFILAHIVEQNIILDECLYDRERYAFFITVGFIYFLRLNGRSSKQARKRQGHKGLEPTVLIRQKLDKVTHNSGQHVLA